MMIQILIQMRVHLAQVNLKLLKMQEIIYVYGFVMTVHKL